MQNQMSVNAQVGLCLGVLLFFSAVCTLVGWLAADQVREKLALFASEGVVADGAITKKHYTIVRPTQGAIRVYWLDVAFTTESGAPRSDSLEVPNTIWDRYETGQAVKITYARSKPEWFYVPGAAPTARDAGMMDGMFEYGLMACAIFLVGFLAWFFTREPSAAY